MNSHAAQTRSYKVPEQDISDYYRLGYIVLRRLLPASLISDLRREADKGLAVAREEKGPSAQRLQPLHKYEGRIDLQPFRDYSELPALREALDQVFTPDHYVGGLGHHLGILYNPSETPWCLSWHRDMTVETSRMDLEEFEAMMLDWNAANQINCPLYEDHCTWFVPGSNLRIRDLPGEQAVAFPDVGKADPRKINIGVDSPITDPAEKELVCDAYVRSMPGAVQFHLGPGDMAIYRPLGWHVGNYLPYAKRATIHDTLVTRRFAEWQQAWLRGSASGKTSPWRKDTKPAAAVSSLSRA